MELLPIIKIPKEELEVLLQKCPETIIQLRIRDSMISELEIMVLRQKVELKRWEDAAR